jgi:hypothetical protein
MISTKIDVFIPSDMEKEVVGNSSSFKQRDYNKKGHNLERCPGF